MDFIWSSLHSFFLVVVRSVIYKMFWYCGEFTIILKYCYLTKLKVVKYKADLLEGKELKMIIMVNNYSGLKKMERKCGQS